ncbi:unnamed protein product [Coregonus sp. 'balchen']|nr:unnamed protein product [Coregonus sp. 'balchen']
MDGNRTSDPSCRDRPPVAIDIIFQECWYIYQKVPSHKKSAIIWVNGAAPVIGTMSCLGMWIPRATMFTDMTSACYFAIVVFKFLVLMIEEVGGDEAFLRPLWPVAIMFMHLRITLRSLKIIPKYAMYQLVLVLSQLQSAIINILALNGTIACTPPYSSQARGYLMSQQLLILEMFIITLVTRLLYRRQYDPLPDDEHDDEHTKRVLPALTA